MERPTHSVQEVDGLVSFQVDLHLQVLLVFLVFSAHGDP